MLVQLIRASSQYYSYAVVYHQESFIYFGGSRDGRENGNSVIAKYDPTRPLKWSSIGSLVSRRYGNGAVFDGNYFLVVGGKRTYDDRDPIKTEKCTLNGSTMTCQEQQPELEKYVKYPELFLVAEDYCKNI